MMQDALDALPDGAEATSMLESSYALLFSGAGGPATVAPYESAFAPRGGRLFGESEARMRTLLRHLDVHVAAGPGEPADHVAIECAVMAELPAGAPPRADLVRRLDAWLVDFRDACGAFDERGFYAGAATIAAALARQERTAAPIR
jgi:TorA-specific chaperone